MAKITQVQTFERPQDALFNVRVTSSHEFLLSAYKKRGFVRLTLSEFEQRDKFIDSYPFFRLLINKGLPYSTLLSMLKCGQYTGQAMDEVCGCTTIRRYLRHKCSSRVCPSCSQIRQKRLVERYELLLKRLCRPVQPFSLLLFTISPQNYKTLKEGFIHVRQGVIKLLRRKYFKKRIKGGIYVIEAKSLNDKGEAKGWNIHVHILCYSRFLNNRLYGQCSRCKSKVWVKKNKKDGLFYCNRKSCNNIVEWNNEDSVVVQELKNTFNRALTADVRPATSRVGSLNYILKYISSNKEQFSTPDDYAEYITFTRDKRLIQTFGSIYSYLKYYKKIPLPCTCPLCNQIIAYSLVMEVCFPPDDTFTEKVF